MKQCSDIFNISVDELVSAVSQTNEFYGGFSLVSSRIVLPNGSVDPWHALGVTWDLTPELPAVFIKGGWSFYFYLYICSFFYSQ